MFNLKAALVKPLHMAALATGASTWLAHRKPRRRIIMFHGVDGGELSATAFEAGLAWLAQRFKIVPLDDMVQAITVGTPPAGTGELSLTFDDGLRNQVEVAGCRATVDAVDVQRRAGMPAFAVDQYQHVGRGQATQGGRTHDTAGVPTRAVGQVE